MTARRFFVASFVASALAFAGPTFAQKPADAPQNATAKCEDSTYSFAKQHSGACSHHQGVAEWYK